MTNITNLVAPTLTMTSLEISELVESRHDKVRQSIERLAARGVISLPPMGEVKIQRERRDETVSVYQLEKRDSYVVVAQLSPEFTARLVDRWQELEAMVDQPRIPQTMPEALRLAAEAIEQRDMLALENKAQAEALAVAEPKAAALDLIAAGEKSITIREAAKLLDVREQRLTSWLHERGWTYRLNGRWVAKQEHIQGGRLIYKEARYTDQVTGHEVYAPYCHITPKGLAKLARELGVEQLAVAA